MADHDQIESQAGEKKFPLKTIAVIGGILLVEAVIITGAFLMAGKPATVVADGVAADEQAMAEQEIEELIVAEKFPNTRTGRTYLYDTEVYIIIRRKYQQQVQQKVDMMTARVTAEIATIFRRADPTHLEEPTLATITRQIKAALDELIGRDEQSGDPLVAEVLIRKCTRFRADY